MTKKQRKVFKEAAEAYEVLSSPEKKARYDRYGHAGMGGASSGGGYSGHDMTMEDIFSSFGDIFWWFRRFWRWTSAREKSKQRK